MTDQQKDREDLQRTLKRMLELSEDYEYVSILRSVIGLGWEEYNKQVQEEEDNNEES